MDRYPKYIGVDFDGTMSFYEHWEGPDKLGEPIPEMIRKIKAAMSQGSKVWIFTARVNPGAHEYKQALEATEAFIAIAEWSKQVFGELLPITHEKNKLWEEIWDDRGRRVIANTGVFADEVLAAHRGPHR